MAEQFSPTYEDKNRGVAETVDINEHRTGEVTLAGGNNETVESFDMPGATRIDCGVDAGGSATFRITFYQTSAKTVAVGANNIGSAGLSNDVAGQEELPSPHFEVRLTDQTSDSSNNTYNYSIQVS
jgi:hypothetical protein